MQESALSKYVGQIIGLDLINGVQVVTRVRSITNGVVLCGPLVNFQAHVGPKDPSKPPHPQTNPVGVQVQALPYGAPLFEPKEKKQAEISLDHILMVLEPQGDLKQAYERLTSSVVTADASFLADLDRINKQAQEQSGGRPFVITAN